MTTPRRLAYPLLPAAFALLFVACDANHTVGNQDDLTGTTCCYITITGQKVASCQGETNCICSPDICNRGSSCQTDKDCPQLGVACQQCADGSAACPVDACVNGTCKVTINTCPKPSCTADNQCPAPDACKQCPDGSAACAHGACKAGSCEITWDSCPTPECGATTTSDGGITSSSACAVPAVCQACPDGTDVCAMAACKNGMCITYFPPCPPPKGGCTSDGNCPQPGAPCQKCSDGTLACPKAWCEAGVCKASFPTCPPPACKIDSECPGPATLACHQCSDGSSSCPVGACVNGACQIVYPPCPTPKGCTADSQCPSPVGPSCKVCANGTQSCPSGACVNGACTIAYRPICM